MERPFHFKQFSVRQDRCAMKIGTDGVLLGAWISLRSEPDSILDIGAGTGIIGLMMAQRSRAQLIDALEIDDKAYEQCVDNFEASPWSDRLFCYHAGLNEFAQEMEETYELIVCNPPFFEAPKNNPQLSEERQKARFTDSLPHRELISAVARLLYKNGQFAVIVPYENQDGFMQLAAAKGLHVQRLTAVRGRPESPRKRSLLQFGREEKIPKINELIIETGRHQYTPEYRTLTKNFYLKM